MSLYESTIPVLINKLENLKHIVQLGAQHAADNDIDESTLINFRLYPDMLPFKAQINIPTDIACGCTARMTGNKRLSLNDDSDSFGDLMARIDQTIDHLKAQNCADYDGCEDKEIVIKTPFGEMKFSGTEYVAHFLFPNIYFHITTAYNILRHNGVKLGKRDFMQGAGQ